ncbi:MAG TPA: hypothetical protein VMI10_07835 [Terriglobales bacterium]|nr:hypothetical protein [Terriglobales bacterium]
MKKTLLVLSILVLTTAAFAQYGGATGYRPSEPQVFHAPEHPQFAGYATMRAETNIYPGASYISAQGDRPASDFPQAASASLGDIARELKKQHDQVKKSAVVWINQ